MKLAKELRHSLEICKSANRAYIVEEFVNYTKEYRIHVSSLGRCFYTCRKMLKEEVAAEERWFRNSKNCVWMLEENPLFDKPSTWNLIVEDCLKALAALGLDTCAFDVKVSKKGEWTILEGNSAPSFGECTPKEPTIVALRYIEELNELIKSKS